MALRILQAYNFCSSTGFRHARPRNSARYHDYVRLATPGGIIRVPLVSQKVIGRCNDRGNRGHQEDFLAFATLSLDPEELRYSLKKFHGVDWDPEKVGEPFARQVVFVGIYDGHGGSAVSQYLRQELHGIFESVDKSHIPDLFAWVQELGGYFKRFKGGALIPWIKPNENTPPFDLEARATQAFFEIDRNMSSDSISYKCGATASVALLHSLDVPATPFFMAKTVALTVAHVGDTRVLLAPTKGKVFPMTENHHADARVESIRLRRMMGSSLITDSFGDSRWMGVLTNTRCLGDLRWKPFGVTPEPEVRTKLLTGEEWACVILASDGVTQIVSDQEIIDLARTAPDPKSAAERIVAFAQELGSDDNATALVVPLAGWTQARGEDRTKELREYRRQQAVGTERQRRM